MKTFKRTTLVALTAFVAATSTGCIKGPDAESLDFGSEEKVQDIADALSKPTENMNPLDIKVGEFFAIEETQELAGGAQSTLIRDTGATITAKDENVNRVVFSGVIHEATYENDGSVSKVSKEGNLLCVSKVTGGCGEEPEELTPAKTLAALTASQIMTKSVTAQAARTTYHRLTNVVQKIPPPPRVRTQPNCLGIPDCLITVHRVGFDQVIWDGDKPTRIHIDAVLSPDVPYLSRNLSTCYTTVATVDSTSGGILVKQCTNVFDFRF